MKPLIKNITGLLAGLALCIAVDANALTALFSGVGIAHTNILTGPARITSIIINHMGAVGATNITYRLLDSPATNLAGGYVIQGRAIGAYTTRVSVLTWVTNWTTNFGSGLVYSNAMQAVSNYNSTVAASTNLWGVIAAGEAVSNAVTTIVLPDDGVRVIYGLGVTNNTVSTPFSINVTYFPTL